MSRLKAHPDADSAKKLSNEFSLHDAETGDELARGFWATVFSFVMHNNNKDGKKEFNITNEETGITFGPFRRR